MALSPLDFPRVKIGETRYARIAPEHIFLEDVFTLKSACLNFQKWKKFQGLFDAIEYEVGRVEDKAPDVNFRRHIGGYWYVSVKSGYYCVDVRKFYRKNGQLKPTRDGLALRFREWFTLMDSVSEIYNLRPDILQTTLCYESHGSHEGIY